MFVFRWKISDIYASAKLGGACTHARIHGVLHSCMRPSSQLGQYRMRCGERALASTRTRNAFCSACILCSRVKTIHVKSVTNLVYFFSLVSSTEFFRKSKKTCPTATAAAATKLLPIRADGSSLSLASAEATAVTASEANDEAASIGAAATSREAWNRTANTSLSVRRVVSSVCVCVCAVCNDIRYRKTHVRGFRCASIDMTRNIHIHTDMQMPTTSATRVQWRSICREYTHKSTPTHILYIYTHTHTHITNDKSNDLTTSSKKKNTTKQQRKQTPPHQCKWQKTYVFCFQLCEPSLRSIVCA